MMETVSLATAAPRVADYDVVVCGGGSAGVCAAIAAARAGARTALVEKNGLLGGTTTAGGVNFPGLFHAWGRQVIAGIGWELIEECVARGGATLPDFSQRPERHSRHQVLVDRFLFTKILDDACVEAGVDLWLHTMPAALVRDGTSLHLVVCAKEGLVALGARKLVDATGDANLAAIAGCELQQSPRLQPGTLVYKLDGYDPDEVDRDALAARYAEAAAAGRIRHTDHPPGDPPMWSVVRSRGGSCMHVTGIDAATSAQRTHAELEGRRALARVVDLLRGVPGMERLRVAWFAPECGIRDTRRIVGEAQIDGPSYIDARVWPDAVCYSFYPIDIHRPDDSTIDIRPLREGRVPTIPYGALVPRGSNDLLAAGRCISGDLEASSAYRVQATCMATGQAAGAAAALAARDGVSVGSVDIAELRALLAEHGAIVPEVAARV